MSRLSIELLQGFTGPFAQSIQREKQRKSEDVFKREVAPLLGLQAEPAQRRPAEEVLSPERLLELRGGQREVIDPATGKVTGTETVEGLVPRRGREAGVAAGGLQAAEANLRALTDEATQNTVAYEQAQREYQKALRKGLPQEDVLALRDDLNQKGAAAQASRVRLVQAKKRQEQALGQVRQTEARFQELAGEVNEAIEARFIEEQGRHKDFLNLTQPDIDKLLKLREARQQLAAKLAAQTRGGALSETDLRGWYDRARGLEWLLFLTPKSQAPQAWESMYGLYSSAVRNYNRLAQQRGASTITWRGRENFATPEAAREGLLENIRAFGESLFQ